MGQITEVRPGGASASTDRLSRGTIAKYSTGSLGTGGFATLPGLVLVYFLTDSLGVTAALAGLIVVVAKVWDVLIDPIIGDLSDRSLRRTGSRARFMRIGAVFLPIFFLATFAVPTAVEGRAAGVWVLVAFIAAATAFSLFQVPYIALPAELTENYDERTRLLTWRVVVLTLAILMFGGGGPMLRALGGDNERLGYAIMALVAGLVIALGFYISSKVAPQVAPSAEPAGARVSAIAQYKLGISVLRRSKPFRTLLGTFFLQGLATGMMLAGAQYVAKWVLHSESAVTLLFVALIAPALLMAPVWGRIALRVGKEKAFAWATILFIVGSLALMGLAVAPGAWVYAAVGLCGAAYAGMQSLPMAMLPDVITHDANTEMSAGASRAVGLAAGAEAGADAAANAGVPALESPVSTATTDDQETRAGVFGGVWTAGETTGMALGSTALTLVLALTGYLESSGSTSVVQPDSAVLGIVLAFSLIPALATAASLVTLRAYPLRRADVHRGPGGR
ncbi:MFS transporter [Timonella senegalensis]|uniref:MFS transporter n=1 Tax=Timonella senegalensis TaxID=1465825 RepID=UPI0006879129|nr:MFS transporter [Timonella senegalensis]